MASAEKISDVFKKTASKSAKLKVYRKMLDIVDECTNCDKLNPNLKAKIYDILYSKEVAPALKINTKYSVENLLGLSFTSPELTNDEQQKLEKVVRVMLRCRKRDPDVVCSAFTEEFNFSKLKESEKILLDLRTKLVNTHNKYLENLLTYQKLLESVLQMKLNDSKDLVDKKIKSSELTAKSLRLKSNILHQKAAISVFTEIPLARQAYEMAIGNILKQQSIRKEEIEQLKELKQKYKLVSCKQFEEILTSYLSYKTAIEKKREILEKIK